MGLRVAILGDCHANLAALEAVLRDLKGHAPDRIYHAGDVVDCGVHPKEVSNLLISQKILGVRGNHDEAAALGDARLVGVNTDPEKQEKIRSFLEWTHQRLSIENRKWLLSLPHSIEIVPGTLLVHGLPGNNTEGIKPEEVSEKAPLAFEAAGPRIRTLICAHTHLPINRKLTIKGEEYHLINIGSVGLPRHGRPRPMYVILDFEESVMTSKFYEAEYDYEETARELEKEMGTKTRFAEMIRTGR